MISPVVGAVRIIISEISTSSAAIGGVHIIVLFGSWLTNGRTIWGVTKPTKPIMPVTAVMPPTIKVVPISMLVLSLFMSTPVEVAVSSP